VLLFTWNLHQKEATFLLALEHLSSSGDNFIGCLQELPPVVGTTDQARDTTKEFFSDSIRCLGVTPAAPPYKHGRVGLFCSPNLTPQPPDVEQDPRQRMAMAFLKGARMEPLLVIGYHGVSREDAPTEAERGSIGTLARQEIDKRWGQEPLIMLGDFNANPFDGEVCGNRGIYAVRHRRDARQERASPLLALGRKQRPLYNPMWSLLPESMTRAEGTHMHTAELMLRWRLYDQVLLSPDLIDHTQDLPEILTAIAGSNLLTRDGNPDKNISDHLPVQLRVNI